MGLIACRARLLLEAKKTGVDFSKTLTLGRQMNNMTDVELSQLRKSYSIEEMSESQKSLRYRSYADQFFFHYLGVRKLSVMDISAYQGSDIIHDLNLPIENELKEAFDVIVDGGSLEHIFNFPTAILNCMKMLKNGGNIFVFSMANNHCGHGFYQFSPELFFRIFQASNGFETKAIILVKHPFPGAELSRKQECFQAKDPAVIGRRSVIVTKSPLGIMVHATKVADRQIFKDYPQQSDYLSLWQANDAQVKEVGSEAPMLHSKNQFSLLFLQIWKRLPFGLRMLIGGFHQLWKCSIERNKVFYTKWP